MTTQKWFFSLISSLMIALVALAWLSRPSFCLDSRLVQKIDIISEGQIQSLTSCQISREGFFSEPLQDLKVKLERRLHIFEQSFDFLGVQAEPIRLSVVDSLDPLVRIHPSRVILSRSVLDSKWILEKALLLSHLLKSRGLNPLRLTAEDILAAEVISDLIIYYESGQLQIDDPVLNQSLQWTPQAVEWPFSLKTENSYCQSPWRSLLHLSKCQQSGVQNDELIVSLRPFLGASLAGALQKIKGDHQLRILRSLLRSWPGFRFVHFQYGASVGRAAPQQLADAQISLNNFLRSLEALDVDLSGWLQEARRELVLRGHSPQPRDLDVDLIVYGDQREPEVLLQGLREAARLAPQKKMLFVRAGEVIFLPDERPIPQSWLGAIRARQAILVQCATPSMDQFKSGDLGVQKMMLVENCNENLSINWSHLLGSGVEAFIADNPKLSFVQFHLPSLRAALQKKNLNPIPLLNSKNWESPFFREIGWEDPHWDQALRAYRTRAAVDAIESFRFSTGESNEATSAPL